MSWIASGLTIIGNIILIEKKSWWCFVVFAIGNALWVGYWSFKEEWAAMILCSFFFFQNVYGFYSWRKHES